VKEPPPRISKLTQGFVAELTNIKIRIIVPRIGIA
jgi:hypothetical protein